MHAEQFAQNLNPGSLIWTVDGHIILQPLSCLTEIKGTSTGLQSIFF